MSPFGSKKCTSHSPWPWSCRTFSPAIKSFTFMLLRLSHDCGVLLAEDTAVDLGGCVLRAVVPELHDALLYCVLAARYLERRRFRLREGLCADRHLRPPIDPWRVRMCALQLPSWSLAKGSPCRALPGKNPTPPALRR